MMTDEFAEQARRLTLDLAILEAQHVALGARLKNLAKRIDYPTDAAATLRAKASENPGSRGIA
jgi:hypothetical protein